MFNRNWHHTWQSPGEARLIDEDIWFREHQKLLVQMANIDFGRDLLNIPKEYPRIVRITKNEVTAIVGMKGDRIELLSDFRVGAKWANSIRYRWGAFQSYSRYFNFRAPAIIERNAFISPLVSAKMAVRMDTLTAYPDPNVETSTVDGSVSLGGTSATWATVRDAADGSSADDSGTTALPLVGKNGTGQFEIRRIFALFDTSSLTASSLISAATLSLFGDGLAGANNDNDGDDFFCIVTSSPASNTALVVGDYDQVGSTEQHDAGQRKDYSVVQNAYNDFAFNATGVASLSKTGISKYGVREGHDLLNSAYAGANNTYNWKSFYMADQTGTTNDPKLVVTYTLPAAFFPRIIVA